MTTFNSYDPNFHFFFISLVFFFVSFPPRFLRQNNVIIMMLSNFECEISKVPIAIQTLFCNDTLTEYQYSTAIIIQINMHIKNDAIYHV